GPAPHQKYSNQGDPTLAFCGDGTVVFGYLDYNGASAPHRLLVTRSTDGGRTWLGPGIVQETNGFPFADKPYIACAPAGGSYPNRAYVSWTNFGTTSPIRVVFSTDRGQTWTGAKNVSGGYGVQGSIPVAAANGLVYVFWLGPSGIEFTKSTNGGGTWAAYRTVSSASSIPGTQFRRNSFPTAGIDRSGGAHAGNVYVAWSDNRNGDPDILFSRSTDAGNTWSAPLRVNDDALGNGRDQFFPWLAVDEKGNVHLMWHDRRDDPANDRIHVYIATSHDGGLSFDANLRVTDLPSRGSLTGFLGDYAALAAGAGKVFPFWSDLRAGTGEEDVFLEIEPAFDYDLVKNVRFAADRETLEFDDQEPRVGSAIVYDVLVGDVADLLGGAPWSLARCAGENVNAPPARVDEVPPPGTAVYVLVRAQGPRGVGSYGSGGAHPDAWDGFDEQGACD
ncbi:MAG: exo-alpha-sialidase, partial [Acidobacteria bacterium]|nr:exo-alpha-sialidase [Acidobacteriota bacterium]